MVYSKKTKRRYGKKKKYMKVGRGLRSSSYFIKRTTTQQFTQTAVVPAHTGSGVNWEQQVCSYGAQTLKFNLADLPGYTEFQPLFQRYRIHMIKCEFRPAWMTDPNGEYALNTSTAGNVKFGIPTIHTCIRYDSFAGPANVDEIKQYRSHKSQSFTGSHKRLLYPRILNTIEQQSTSYQVMRTRKTWLSTQTAAGLDYLGIGAGLEGRVIVGANHTVQDTFDFDWLVDCTYYIEFANVK